MQFKGRPRPVSRIIAYICLGLDINNSRQKALHKCDNPSCFNPEHIYVGSDSHNIQDAYKRGRRKGYCKTKTHCKRGHEYNDKNTYIRPDTGAKICKICSSHWKTETK